MELSLIANWLKTSLLGVIVLGALGSIVAILLLRLVNFLMKACGLGIGRWKKREYDQGWRTGTVVGYLKATKDSTLAVFFMAYRLSRVVVASLLTIIFFMVFYSLIPATGPALRVGTFLSAVAFFLALRWVYEDFRHIQAIYKHEIHPIIEAALEAKEQGIDEAQPTNESSVQ
ncbi:MAG: hypothetical protein IH977_17010 [Nitrospinae bacterium]|nr:hypothetical protein [Nitrospinota bacterium]